MVYYGSRWVGSVRPLSDQSRRLWVVSVDVISKKKTFIDPVRSPGTVLNFFFEFLRLSVLP